MRSASFISLIVVAVLGSVTAAHGAIPCELIEIQRHDETSKLWTHPDFKRSYRVIKSAGVDGKRHKRALKSLETALDKLMTRAHRVFHDVPQRSFKDTDKRQANAFLKAHVFGASAPLRIGELGFEPSDELAMAIMRSACLSKAYETVITWGRRGTSPHKAQRRAIAALLLDQLGRRTEAKRLVRTLPIDTFLQALVVAMLHDTPSRKKAASEAAARLAKSDTQHKVLRQRLPGSPNE